MVYRTRRSKLKAKTPARSKANVNDDVDNAVVYCAVCAKAVPAGKGKIQKRWVMWNGKHCRACNACGISWKTYLCKVIDAEKREPTREEWAEWDLTRPKFEKPTPPLTDEERAAIEAEAIQAAKTLVGLRRAGRTLSMSPSSAHFSPSLKSESLHSPLSSFGYSHQPIPSSDEATLEVESAAPSTSNRPTSLYVDVGPSDEAYSDFDLSYSSYSDHSPLELITPLSISFFDSSSSLPLSFKDNVEVNSAYPPW